MKCVIPLNAFCRLCLDVDVKVHKLSTTHAVLVENIFNLKDINFVDVQCDEQYVCSICLSLLSKTNNFVQMIFRAQNLLDDLMETNDVITKPMLKSIDRHIEGLNLLSVRSFGIFDEDKKNYGVDPRDNYIKTNQIKSKDINKTCKKSKQKQINLKDINKTKNNVENEYIEISTSTDEDFEEPLIDVSLENESKEMGNNPLKENLTLLVSSNNKTTNKSPDPYSLENESKEMGNNPLEENLTLLVSSNIKTNNNSPDRYSLENESKEMGNNPLEENITLLVSSNDTTTNNSPDPYNNNAPHIQKSVPVKRKAKVDPESCSFSETESSTSSEDENKQKRDADYQPDTTSEDSDFVFYKKTFKQHMKPKPRRLYPRQCDHCDYEVLRKRDHYRHYLYEHPDLEYPYPSAGKLYPCLYCGVLKKPNRLKAHEESHTMSEHKCPLCPKVFRSQLLLTGHKYTVHGRHIFTCDYCSKSFKTRTDIMRHIRIHTGEKPFKCHICGAGFAHSGNRLVHIRSAHQNIRYVPKKRKQKKMVRRNKKHDLTDTDSEYHSGEEIVRKKNTKKASRNKRQLQPDTEIKPASEKQSKRKTRTKNKFRYKNVGCAGIESGDAKQNDKRKSNKDKVRHCADKKRKNTEQVDCKSDNLN